MKTKISMRILCQLALFIALAFVFERLLKILDLGYARLTFAFVPMMCCGMLYGPYWGAFAYCVADVLGWPIMGMTPIPLVLVSRIISGAIFGLVLHRKTLKFMPHAFIIAFTEPIICGAGLATLGLSLPPSYFAGNTYIELLFLRLPFVGGFIVLQLAVFPVLIRFRDALNAQLKIPDA